MDTPVLDLNLDLCVQFIYENGESCIYDWLYGCDTLQTLCQEDKLVITVGALNPLDSSGVKTGYPDGCLIRGVHKALAGVWQHP